MTKNTTNRKDEAIRIGSYILGAMFVLAGATKLASMGDHAAHFAAWGFPAWFLYVVGATEVAAGALLVASKTRFIAAATLASTMVGAVGTHVVAGEFSQTAAPAAFLIATGAIAYATRHQLSELLARVRRVASSQ